MSRHALEWRSTPAPGAQHELALHMLLGVARSRGMAVDPKVRGMVEAASQRGFGVVENHDDARTSHAVEAARAQAYTVRPNIAPAGGNP